MMKTANLVLAFLLELAMLAAFGWRALMLGGWLGWVAAIVAVAAAIGLWAMFGAPRSPRRLAGGRLLAFKIVMFGLAAVALLTGGAVWLGVGFAVLAGANLWLAQIWRQEQGL